MIRQIQALRQYFASLPARPAHVVGTGGLKQASIKNLALGFTPGRLGI